MLTLPYSSLRASQKDFDDIVMNCNFPNLSEDEADDVRLQFATVYYSG